ncbi:PLAT/LH2 domain-containing protein [Paraburkholderia sediminicola]|uniref:PLAT/LH2 domain-containing protein n=1 Tax=Paraburkholderia sediminicola TaxID=458836 RepID=UPI0038BC4B95
MFIRIARLAVVAAEPERQQEVFGWVTPPKDDPLAQARFAFLQAVYWRGPDPHQPVVPATFQESLEEVYTQQDTADFHANYLLRLLYLYGDTPRHLRTADNTWRTVGRLGRDINFPGHAEALVRTNLLEFKYWMDEPFYADDDDGRLLRKWRANRATQIKFARPNNKDFTPEDPENDTYRTEMTFWSENHQVLFATAEYLAGQLWPQTIFRVGNSFRKEGPDKTRSTDLLGSQRMDRARPRLLRWLNDRMRFGFSEWNSPGYYDEDFTALFNLADFCLDREIRIRSCIVIDLLIFDLARFTHRGSFGVSAGRCYFESKNCGYEQSVGDLIEVLFGARAGVITERSSTCAGSFVSSTGYQVPDVLIAVAQDREATFVDRSRVSINMDEAPKYGVGYDTDEDVWFWWSRNGYFAPQVIKASLDMAVKFHLMKTSPFTDVFPQLLQIAALGTDIEHLHITAHASNPSSIDSTLLVSLAGLGSIITEGAVLSRANLYTYRSPAAMLSSVQNFHAGQVAFQVQTCQATLSLDAAVWTTYPAAGDLLKISGKHDGPNWWTGSSTTPRVVQMKNAAIIAYKPTDLQLILFGHRTHAWFPKAAFDKGTVIQRTSNANTEDGLWTFGQVGDGYVGLFSAHRPDWTTTGPWTDNELIAEGARNVFILQIGSKSDFGSFSEFVDAVSHARIHIGGLALVTAGEVAGAGGGLVAGAALGAEVAGVPGAVVGAVAGAIYGATKTAEDFECSYDVPGAGRLELHYDEQQVRSHGRQFSDDNFPRFENPYVKCERVGWGQSFYTIKHGGHSLTHDFRAIENVSPSSDVVRLLDASEIRESNCDAAPRPFYIFGHNPNSIPDVLDALNAGANAIEPDVNVFEHRQNTLCISETGLVDTDKGGDSDAPTLAQYLDDLHAVVHAWPELAFVVFDCKPKVATGAHGASLLSEIRKRLTYDNHLNIVISVSSRSEAAIFDDIKGILGPREGCMIDEDNDPTAVASLFVGAGISNRCYGNGNKFQNPVTSPNLRPSIELACGLRAGRNSFQFIYEWTNNEEDRMREFIRTGVDGIITDDVAVLKAVTEEDEFQTVIRYAVRKDNPFTPTNANYVLSVHTGDVYLAGTSANITFTVKGTLGTMSKIVDASLDGRMARDDWNFVTIQSPDLGELLSITVQRDNEGSGPDWYLERILVQSYKYGVSRLAVFNRWIDTTAPFNQRLE